MIFHIGWIGGGMISTYSQRTDEYYIGVRQKIDSLIYHDFFPLIFSNTFLTTKKPTKTNKKHVI